MFTSEPGPLPRVLELSGEESRLFDEATACCRAHGRSGYRQALKRFSEVRALGAAIARFPPERDSLPPDRDKLLALLAAEPEGPRPLHLPGRVIGARSFLVAKCRAFSLLARLVERDGALYQAIRRVLFSILYTLLAEDAYLAALESPGFSPETKRALAGDLLVLWERGDDPRKADHFPALEALWTARDNTVPGFGSMTGATEFLLISMELEEDWKDFIADKLENDEALAALEEFLFGLSWEEIREVRSRLETRGAYAISHADIHAFLENSGTYAAVNSRTPKAICDFFIDRREMAVHRRYAAAAGPRRTIEEMYLCFRLARQTGVPCPVR
ncbi:MAG: hypothetical protein LBC88_00260 [Spirochaetaceae bacterium]|nr:hypothetical protein [Spirochaetaceae bacterium]